MFSAERLLNMRMFLDGCVNYSDMHSMPKVIREIYANCATPEQKKSVLVRLFTAILPNSSEDSLIFNDNIFRRYDNEFENDLLEHIESDILNAAFDQFKDNMTLDDLKHKYTGDVPRNFRMPYKEGYLIEVDHRIINAAELSYDILRKITPYLSTRFDAFLIEFDNKFIAPNDPFERSIFLDTNVDKNKYPEQFIESIKLATAKCLHNKIYSPKGFIQFLSSIDQFNLLHYVLSNAKEINSKKWWQPCYFNQELFDHVDLLPKIEKLQKQKAYITLALWLENIGPEKIWKSNDLEYIKMNCLFMVSQMQDDRSWEAIILIGTLLTKSRCRAADLPSEIVRPSLAELFPRYLPEHFLMYVDKVIRGLDKLGYFDAYLLDKNSSLLATIMNYANDFSNHQHGTNAMQVACTLLDLWSSRFAAEDLISLANECFATLNTRANYNKEQTMITIFKKLWPILPKDEQQKLVLKMLEIVLSGGHGLIEQICKEYWTTFTPEQQQMFYAKLEPIKTINTSFALDVPEWQQRVNPADYFNNAEFRQALKMLEFLSGKISNEQAEQYAEKLACCKLKHKVLTKIDKKERLYRGGLFGLANLLENAFVNVFHRCGSAWQDQFIANNFEVLIQHVTLNDNFNLASINILAGYFHKSHRLALYAEQLMKSALQIIIEDRRNVPVHTCDYCVSDGLFSLCADWLINLFPFISNQSQDKVALAIIDRYINRRDITLLKDNKSPYYAIFSRVITIEQQTKICEMIKKQARLHLGEIEIYANLGISREFLQSFYDQAYFRKYTFPAVGLIEDLLNISIGEPVLSGQKKFKMTV